MIKLLTVVSIFINVVGSQNCTNKPMKANKTEEINLKGDDKWTTLFDGKSTKGWHTYGKNFVGNAWKIEDGTLFMDPSQTDSNQRGDIVTDKEYENFHLKLEWKISEGGNSGIIFFINEDISKYGRTYNTGPEMQVLDNNKHADAKIHKHRAGDLYDLIASKEEAVGSLGEWNKVDIIANKGKLAFYLNGKNVVSTTMWDDGWREMIARSKFSTMPGFGIYKKGRIALQDHGNKVWYRNIKIKEL